MLISILKSIASGQGSVSQAIACILSSCMVVFICMPIHELSHAFVAYKLGDTTAKNDGRLSFNPIKHLNPIGTIMIFLFGIGYANPVPVNPRNFKNQKLGMAIVAFAGPTSNLILAFISAFAYCLAAKYLGTTVLAYFIVYFFYFLTYINVSLAAFNFIPVPPLDGSKILAALIPNKYYFKYMQYERYIMIALIIALFFGVFDVPISFLTTKFMYLVTYIPEKILM